MSRSTFPSLHETEKRISSKAPPPRGYVGSRDSWERFKRGVIPIDAAAMWLAQFPHAELQMFEAKNIDGRKLKRHIGFGEIDSAFTELAWIKQQPSKKLYGGYPFGNDKPTVRLPAFWETWGLLIPHPLPREWLEARCCDGTFPGTRTSFPDGTEALIREEGGRESFASFIRYASLVRLPQELINIAYDLCVPESS